MSKEEVRVDDRPVTKLYEWNINSATLNGYFPASLRDGSSDSN